MMAPQFAQAASLLEPQVRFAKVNTEVEQGLGAQFTPDVRAAWEAEYTLLANTMKQAAEAVTA